MDTLVRGIVYRMIKRRGGSSQGIESGGIGRGALVERDRGTLKVLTHGWKLKRPKDDYIWDIIDDSSPGPLIEGTHSMIDRRLTYAFTERWHRETSSFHLPVGCTIFADKSVTAVRVTYLELLRDLRTVGNITWGAVALAYLYEQLKDVSCHNTRRLPGLDLGALSAHYAH
ncbi:putative serine/threonine-protein phosphatase 7 long form-like protein [Sesbania bispinosa]|nr:putative serine/threonine-protein phosphatase 7 long form-like protein [Sesbania bispinosa]